jgi:Fe-S-cluster-containing dehydrogenase component
MKTILIDPSRCLQCCNCQNACKDEHVDNEWLPYAAKQGKGQFWIQIRESQAASGTRMRLNRVPVPCQHCADAPCIAAANGAIYRRDDGIVIIDPQKAKGIKGLAEACPYGAIYWNAELDLAQKCTLCAHLLDAGWEKPRCVTACPVDALSFVEAKDLSPENTYAPLEELHPEYNTSPTVAYVNVPKPFIAGAVYSPNEDLCLEGVNIKVERATDERVYTTKTDFLGEFRVAGLNPGYYTLYLEKSGYSPKRIAKLDVRSALNVQEVKLYPTQQGAQS